MFNTTQTRTTKYGYSNTITLAEAMINRQRNMCTNLAANFGDFAICFVRETSRKGVRS